MNKTYKSIATLVLALSTVGFAQTPTPTTAEKMQQLQKDYQLLVAQQESVTLRLSLLSDFKSYLANLEAEKKISDQYTELQKQLTAETKKPEPTKK